LGIVWEAIERRFERRVALKVHARGAAAPREEVEMEARLAARIEDPGVVRIYDVGLTLDGAAFFTMELVDGRDLSAALEDGPLAATRAVLLLADVARAVGAAHALGIVHRDLKPKNIMIDRSGRARVLDFGVALHDRAASMSSGFLTIGTPPYMSPEQLGGLPLGPPSDVYALGVVLFRMLTGRLPFDQTDPGELARHVLSEPPPPLRDLVPGAHDDLVWVVETCLQKAPDARFAHAGELAELLVALSEGRPVRVGERSGDRGLSASGDRDTAPPRIATRPRREDAKKQFRWTYELGASPAALWPHVADTDRFNRAVGLAPVVYQTVLEETGELRRTGANSAVGLDIAWEEHPFEWVREQWHEVRRTYHKGPLSALWNTVTLAPREGGGSTLTHEIFLDPRGLIGSLAAFVEIEHRLATAMRKVYAHIDAVALGQSPEDDPFEPPHKPAGSARAAIEDGETRLVRLGFAPALVARLAHALRFTPTGGLEKMRPFALADRWGTPRKATLELFLHAADIGLLSIAWDLVCPRCRVAHEQRGSLADLARTGRCSACAEAYESDLLTSVELVFRPQTTVRQVPTATYCLGSPARRPHVLAQILLGPGERRDIELPVALGSHRFFGSRRVASPEVLATAVAFGHELVARVRDGRIEVSVEAIAAGVTRLTLVNETSTDCLLRLESARSDEAAVSAAVAMVHPTFRELFGQLLSRGEHFSVSHSALLFVGLVDVHGVFRHLGDAGGVSLLADTEIFLAERARRESGVVVQQSQGVLLALFPNIVAALQVARAVLEGAGAVPGGLRAAVHGGRVLALGRPSGVELAGATVLQGRALLEEASENAIAISEKALRDEATRALLSPLALRHHGATTAGLGGMRVAELLVTPREASVPLDDQTKVEGSQQPSRAASQAGLSRRSP
jgi:serine/threonine protein kinase